jgi:hypothetical protein
MIPQVRLHTCWDNLLLHVNVSWRDDVLYAHLWRLFVCQLVDPSINLNVPQIFISLRDSSIRQWVLLWAGSSGTPVL